MRRTLRSNSNSGSDPIGFHPKLITFKANIHKKLQIKTVLGKERNKTMTDYALWHIAISSQHLKCKRLINKIIPDRFESG
jgi:hypothetical protein